MMRRLMLTAVAAYAIAMPALAQQMGGGSGSGGGGGVTSVATACGVIGGPITGAGTVQDALLVNAQSGTAYSLQSSDCGKLLTANNASAVTFNLLAPGTAGNGYWFEVQNLGAGTTRLSPASGQVNGGAYLDVLQGQGVTVATDGSNYFAVTGLGASGVASFNTRTGAVTLQAADVSGVGGLLASNNLSDLANAATARTNLGLAAVASSGSASDLSAGTLAVARGGTGLGSGTSGGVLAFTGAGTLASSAALTANLPVIGGGAGAAPAVGTRSGNTTEFATVSGALTSGNCLKSDASGNVVDNGGTCGSGGGTPGGSSGQIQYNNGGAFGGFAGFTLGVGLSTSASTCNSATLGQANASLFLKSCPNIYTGNHTITATEVSGVVVGNAAGGLTLTLPQAGTTGFENGNTLGIFNEGAGDVTITTTTSVFYGVPLVSSNIVLSTNTGVNLVSDGTNWGASGVVKAGVTAAMLAANSVVLTGSAISGQLPAANMLALATGDLYQGDGSAHPGAVTLSAAIDAGIGSVVQGDILYRGASGWARLGAGTNGQFLKTQGASANPAWATVSGGTGCATTGTVNHLLLDDGAGGCATDANASASNGALSLGASGTAGSVVMGNATSGTITLQPVTGALGAVTVSIPAATDTLVNLAGTQTLTNKTISGASNTLSSIGNGSLSNSSMTIAGHAVSLGGSQAIACGDLSNGATGCSTATGTSGATLPLLNTANSWSAGQRGAVSNITISTATFTPSFDAANNFEVDLIHASCPCTLANPSTTPVAGQSGMIAVKQSATGSDTIGTWGSQYLYVGGTSTIALSTAASTIDYLPYYVFDATHIVLGALIKGAAH